jgi:hypothetical protein
VNAGPNGSYWADQSICDLVVAELVKVAEDDSSALLDRESQDRYSNPPIAQPAQDSLLR